MATATARRVWRRLEEELEPVEVEGQPASVLSADTEAIATMEPDHSVRLVPNFDAYLLAYHPRSAFVADGVREAIFRPQGWISPVVLAGGEARGIWELERKPDRAVVRVEPFGRLAAGARKQIAEEAQRLAAFVGLEAETRFEPVTFLKRPAGKAAAR
jgi:hypothetical protein